MRSISGNPPVVDRYPAVLLLDLERLADPEGGVRKVPSVAAVDIR